MRAILPVVALGFLAACTYQRSAQYSAPAPISQPPVSYQTTTPAYQAPVPYQTPAVAYTDAPQAPTVDADSAASAAAYCQRYGKVAQLQSVQPPNAGNTAFYNCVSTAPTAYGAGPYGTAPTQVYQTQTYPAPIYQPPGPVYGTAPVYNGPTYNGGSAAPVVRCADPLHQDRPGGTDYRGPPVPGC
jgi:hypothetical protein